MIYVRTYPREYWDFGLFFRTPETNGLLMTGEALMATLQEAFGTVFNVTRHVSSGDFRAIVDFNQLVFTYVPLDDGRMEFKASLSFVMIDKVGRVVDTMSLQASTITAMPDGQAEQIMAATKAVAELLSIMEKDLASHALTAWDEGRYAVF